MVVRVLLHTRKAGRFEGQTAREGLDPARGCDGCDGGGENEHMCPGGRGRPDRVCAGRSIGEVKT